MGSKAYKAGGTAALITGIKSKALLTGFYNCCFNEPQHDRHVHTSRLMQTEDVRFFSHNFGAWWKNSYRVCKWGSRCPTYPCPGSRAMARGCSIPPAMSVVRISPLSLATSIWSRLLSIQYSFPVIQSTARPSGVARPCCTTTSIPVTPETALAARLHDFTFFHIHSALNFSNCCSAEPRPEGKCLDESDRTFNRALLAL